MSEIANENEKPVVQVNVVPVDDSPSGMWQAEAIHEEDDGLVEFVTFCTASSEADARAFAILKWGKDQ